MQQASGSIANYPAPPGNFLPPAAASPRFVVNLCASTTPVGLVQPTHAGLKRFTFFVSRRLEEGRERFRLHMGYFDTQEEAEKILDLVRDVYPGAWAGAAPGIRLRARAAAAAAAEAAPVPERASERAAVAAPAPVSEPVAAAVAASPPAIVTAAPAVVASTPPAVIAPAPSATVIQLELVPDRPRAIPAPIVAFESAKDKENAAAAARSLSDVRAAINSLDEAPAETSGAHTTIAPTVAMPVIVPTITRAAPPAAAKSPAQRPANDATLEGPAVLKLLETARPASAAKPRPIYAQAGTERRPVAAAPTNAATPSATAPRAEPALFAVQLLWSVQPIDMSKIPQLAIFSAYTLYGAEGNRDGRRWYGLRLGFFTDAVSAKQVAQYVRSEFTSVSVVPVSVRERARAGAATSKPLPSLSTSKNPGPELNFIEEVQTDTATSGSRPALQLPEETKQAQPAKAQPELSPSLRAAIAAVGVSSKGAAPGGKRVKLRVGQGTKPVSKRPQKRPLSLEETLEILGASELQVDNGRGELINDSSRRSTARVQKATPSGSRFGRLINRLAERLGNS